MPRNPNKTRCSVPGCKAWAIRGSSPPRCSPHTPGKVGAPLANQNRRTHGFYASVLNPQELADLATYAADSSLDAEIALTRVATRRLLTMLDTGATLGPNPQRLDTLDYIRCIALTFQGASLLSRLLRARRDLGDAPPSPFLRAIHEALDHIGGELELPL